MNIPSTTCGSGAKDPIHDKGHQATRSSLEGDRARKESRRRSEVLNLAERINMQTTFVNQEGCKKALLLRL